MTHLTYFNDLISCIAGIALLSAVLEMFTDEHTGGFGFRTVCAAAVILSVFEAVGNLINR